MIRSALLCSSRTTGTILLFTKSSTSSPLILNRAANFPPLSTVQSHFASYSTLRRPVQLPDVGKRLHRELSISSRVCQKEAPADKDTKAGEAEEEEEVEDTKTQDSGRRERTEKKKEDVPRHMEKDRTQVIPLETSLRYMKSAAYKETYGTDPVWVPYRRNFPGQFAPKKTRITCIHPVTGQLQTGNPCPICRDVYLVIHYENVPLLTQFISPHNGEVIGYDKTGVCQDQHEKLIMAIQKAKDYGVITFDVPFREYDYKEYEKIYESY